MKANKSLALGNSGCVLGVFVWLGCALSAPALAAPAGGQASLQRLVDGARREGDLQLMVSSALGEKGGKELVEAFKRRFGLKFNITPDLSGQESQKFNQATMELKSGIPPTFDLMQGGDENVLALREDGGAEPIENWEKILSEISMESYKIRHKVSPAIFGGYGFLWSTRTVVLLYNSKLIAERELPKTWKEMGDAKSNGAFSVPPWTSVALMGILKYNKEEWLEVVRSWGRNKRQVLTYSAGTQRMLLGDIKFLFGNAEDYFREIIRDPNSPIGLTFFEDFTPVRQVLYVVRKGARHPNAAKLFALWATTSEANQLFETHGFTENIVLGNGPITGRFIKKLQQGNIKPANWFDGERELEKFRWLSTAEGREYAKAIARAQREGK